MSKNNICFFQRGSIEIVCGEGAHGFPYHTHESFLIGVIKSGEARFVIGKNKYLLEEGTIYIVPPNIGISITPVKPYSYLTICFKNEMKLNINQYRSDLYIIKNLGDEIIDLCRRFRSEKLADKEFIDKLEEVLEVQAEKDSLNKKCISVEVQDAVKYIKEHVRDKFILDKLAQAVYLSKYHLIRNFKNEMGVSPKHYDQQCKIRKARESILYEKKEVDIAMDLSFSNQSHLCSMFKRYMGISIKDYKTNFEREEQ